MYDDGERTLYGCIIYEAASEKTKAIELSGQGFKCIAPFCRLLQRKFLNKRLCHSSGKYPLLINGL